MKQKGFTLIELLVVISIIGTLAALLLTNFVGIRGRASDTTKKAGLRELKTALRLYYNDHQEYPDTVPTDGSEFTVDSVLYMKELPTDITYTVAADNNSYLLSIELDNASDEDIEKSAAKCDQEYTDGDLTYYECNE